MRANVLAFQRITAPAPVLRILVSALNHPRRGMPMDSRGRSLLLPGDVFLNCF